MKNVLAIIGLVAAIYLTACWLFPLQDATASAVSPNASPADSKELVLTPELQAYQGNYWADMNARYHEAMSRDFSLWAKSTRVVLLTTSMLTLFFGVAHSKYIDQRPTLKSSLKWVSYVGLLLSVLSTLYPWADNAAKHATLAQQWKSLDGEWRKFRSELTDLDKEARKAKMQALMAYQSAMEVGEPLTYNEKAMDKAQDETEEEFGIGKYKEVAKPDPGLTKVSL